MTPLLESLYTIRRMTTASGEVIEVNSEISRDQGLMLHDLITRDPSIRRTLEVGCAYGFSSLHIGEALRHREGAHHTIIDPFQKTQWHSLGLQNLAQAGIDFYELVEEKSEFALPKLAQTQPGNFDLIFIDGWHTFDHALVDAFYALRLLRTGGVLVIDDCDFGSLDRVVSYLENYPCLKVLATLAPPPPNRRWRGKVKAMLGGARLQAILPHHLRERYRKKRSRMIALQKMDEDRRPWDWYVPF